jgi:hypothetical protein
MHTGHIEKRKCNVRSGVAVRYILSHTRRKRRRRPNLSYHQRVRRLSSCVRLRTQWEKPGKSKTKFKFCVVVHVGLAAAVVPASTSVDDWKKNFLENIQLMDRLEQRRWNSHRFRFNPTSLSAFVNEIDPLEHYRQLR